MKKTIFFISLILLSTIVIGCDNTHIESDNLYEIVTIDNLENEDVIRWYEENYKKMGSHTISMDELKGYKYLLISAGEKSTGGYSIEIVDVTEEQRSISFDTSLKEPKEDEAVTMALTYPNLLLKVRADEKTDVTANIFMPEKKVPNDKKYQSEILLYERITGVFNGQIDNNFIEVDIDEDIAFKQQADIPHDPMSFRLSQTAKENITSISEKDKIEFVCYKNDKGTWIIDEIRKLK